jgi:AAA15 family ATPase/GTPase
MIFHKHQTIFFHIGKAAGSSIEHTFLPGKRNANIADYELFYGWDDKRRLYLQHATAAFMQQHIDPKVFSQYFKFTIVRNPFSRLLSAYQYNIGTLTSKYASFEDFVLKLPTTFPYSVSPKGSHFIDQVHYSHIADERVCDEILFFEKLPNAFKVIQHRTQLTKPLLRRNVNSIWHNKRLTVHSQYSKEMVNVVLDVYSRDFDTFTYSADPKKLAASPSLRRSLKRLIFI